MPSFFSISPLSAFVVGAPFQAPVNAWPAARAFGNTTAANAPLFDPFHLVANRHASGRNRYLLIFFLHIKLIID